VSSALSQSIARRVFPVVSGLLLLSPFAYAKDQVPDWVRAASTIPTPDQKNADAVFLLEETTYTVGTDGSLIRHVRKVVKIMRPQGRKYGEMYVGFGKTSKVRSLHIWSIGADGKEYAVKDNEITEFGSSGGFELYSDSRVRGGVAPAMDVGAIAAIEYELQERPFENDIIWVPGENVPVVRERLSLNLPTGYTYHAAWKGKPKADAVDAEHGTTLWEVNNQPGLHRMDPVPLAPSTLSLAPRMDIFYQGPGVAGQYGPMTGDWQGIGEWYERLAKDRNAADAAITAKAQQLVQGKTGFRDRVDAIASYVQKDIRYVAIEIGVGGLQPHPAADIFRYGYGDCKDKATLLSAMLGSVGIRSTWVMVDTTRGTIVSDAPSLFGNHMIAAIELPQDYKPEEMYSIVTAKSGKRFLIFDPTWEKTPFGQLERELQGSDALLVDGANSQAIRLPVLKPEQNRVERKATFQLALDGSLAGDVTESSQGDIARRWREIPVDAHKEQEQALNRSLARNLIGFHAGDLRMTNADALEKVLSLNYSLKVDHFAQSMGHCYP